MQNNTGNNQHIKFIEKLLTRKDTRVFIDTCSLLHEDKRGLKFLRKISDIFEHSEAKLYFAKSVCQELQKHQNNKDNIELVNRARYCLKFILDHKKERIGKGYACCIGKDLNIPFADQVFKTVFTCFFTEYNLVLITQDINLAKDIIALNYSNAIQRTRHINVFRLQENGFLGKFPWEPEHRKLCEEFKRKTKFDAKKIQNNKSSSNAKSPSSKQESSSKQAISQKHQASINHEASSSSSSQEKSPKQDASLKQVVSIDPITPSISENIIPENSNDKNDSITLDAQQESSNIHQDNVNTIENIQLEDNKVDNAADVLGNDTQDSVVLDVTEIDTTDEPLYDIQDIINQDDDQKDDVNDIQEDVLDDIQWILEPDENVIEEKTDSLVNDTQDLTVIDASGINSSEIGKEIEISDEGNCDIQDIINQDDDQNDDVNDIQDNSQNIIESNENKVDVEVDSLVSDVQESLSIGEANDKDTSNEAFEDNNVNNEEPDNDIYLNDNFESVDYMDSSDGDSSDDDSSDDSTSIDFISEENIASDGINDIEALNDNSDDKLSVKDNKQKTDNKNGSKNKANQKKNKKQKKTINAFKRRTKVTELVEEVVPVKCVPSQGDKICTSQGEMHLTKLLGTGGEASVYETDSLLIAKIYKEHRITTRRIAKIKLMLSHEIHYPGICYPKDIVYNQYGEFVGYLMEKAGGQEIQRCAFRKPLLYKYFPTWTKLETVQLCITILQKISYLHRHNIILGDINPANILVVSPEEVYFVDTDSYQIEDLPCPVGTPYFTAPELQFNNGEQLRTLGNENFAIATLLFMIMLPGKSPYAQQGGEDARSNICNMDFSYPFEGNSNGKVPDGPWKYIWSHLPYVIKKSFYGTFRKDAEYAKENTRLSADQWLEKFKEYRTLLKKGTLKEQDPMSIDLFPTRLKKTESSVYVICKLCHQEVDKKQTIKGYCDQCLNKGEKFTCIRCGRESIYTNMERYIKGWEKSPICEACRSTTNNVHSRRKCRKCSIEFDLTNKEYHRLKDKYELQLDLCPNCRPQPHNKNGFVNSKATFSETGAKFSFTKGKSAGTRYNTTHRWGDSQGSHVKTPKKSSGGILSKIFKFLFG